MSAASGRRRPVDEALRDAMYAGDLAGARRALAAGADPNLVIEAGETVLMRAMGVPGDTQIVRMLLARGARVDAGDAQGRTALHHAVFAGRADLVRLLLDRGAAIDAATDRGETALDFASRGASLAVLEALRARLAGTPAAREAAAQSLVQAAGAGDHGTVWKLVALRPEATALTAALHEAARRGDVVLGRGLLDAGADPDGTVGGRRDRPLHTAAWYGQAEVSRLLLERGADPNAADAGGRTPLHVATVTSHAPPPATAALARLLLAAGANPAITDHQGYSVRLAARARGRQELLDLIPAGADEPPEDPTAHGIHRVRLAEGHEIRIDLMPNDPLLPLQISEGPPRDPTGGVFGAATAWERFRADFETAGGSWFLPLLARMAAGERVPWAEVAAAYRAHHGREPAVQRFPALSRPAFEHYSPIVPRPSKDDAVDAEVGLLLGHAADSA